MDVNQNHNLAKDPRYQEQKHKLRQMTQQYRHCQGTGCPTDFYC